MLALLPKRIPESIEYDNSMTIPNDKGPLSINKKPPRRYIDINIQVTLNLNGNVLTIEINNEVRKINVLKNAERKFCFCKKDTV